MEPQNSDGLLCSIAKMYVSGPRFNWQCFNHFREQGFEFREERLLPEVAATQAKSSSLSLHDQLKATEPQAELETEKFGEVFGRPHSIWRMHISFAGAPPSAEDQAYLAAVHRQQLSTYTKQRKQAMRDEQDFAAAVAAASVSAAVLPATAASDRGSKRPRTPPGSATEHEAADSSADSFAQLKPLDTTPIPRFHASQLPSAHAALGGLPKRPRADTAAPAQAEVPLTDTVQRGLVQYSSGDESD